MRAVQWIDVWHNAFMLLDGSIEARAHRAAQLAVEAFGEAPDTEDIDGIQREVYVGDTPVTVQFTFGFIRVRYTRPPMFNGQLSSSNCINMYAALVAEEIKV